MSAYVSIELLNIFCAVDDGVCAKQGATEVDSMRGTQDPPVIVVCWGPVRKPAWS